MGSPDAGISLVIEVYDGVVPADGGSVKRRVKILRSMQLTNDFVHNFREWEWTYTSSALVVLANDNFVALPTGFQNVGDAGFLWDVDRNVPVTLVSKFELMRLRLLSRGTSQRSVFGIFGGKVQLTYAAGSARNFTLFHRVAPEILTDTDTEMLIPDKWFRSVIIPGTVAGGQELKSDLRPQWRAQFADGLKQMATDENPAKAARKPPMAIPGAW